MNSLMRRHSFSSILATVAAVCGIGIVNTARADETGPLRIPGYELAGFVDDLRATRFLSAVSILVEAMEPVEESDILLLVFIGDEVIEDNRIASSKLGGFTEEQALALSMIEVDREECNVLKLASDNRNEVYLLAIERSQATESELDRCLLRLLTGSRGIIDSDVENTTNREMILDFVASF